MAGIWGLAGLNPPGMKGVVDWRSWRGGRDGDASVEEAGIPGGEGERERPPWEESVSSCVPASSTSTSSPAGAVRASTASSSTEGTRAERVWSRGAGASEREIGSMSRSNMADWEECVEEGEEGEEWGGVGGPGCGWMAL